MQISTNSVNFSSLAEALSHLGLEEFVLFRLKGETLYHLKTKEHYSLRQVQIIQTLIFEDHLGSNQLLHLIKTQNDIYGCFIDTMGLYGDLDTMEDDHIIW